MVYRSGETIGVFDLFSHEHLQEIENRSPKSARFDFASVLFERIQPFVAREMAQRCNTHHRFFIMSGRLLHAGWNLVHERTLRCVIGERS